MSEYRFEGSTTHFYKDKKRGIVEGVKSSENSSDKNSKVRVFFNLQKYSNRKAIDWLFAKKNTNGYLKHLVYSDMYDNGIELDEKAEKYLDDSYCEDDNS